MKLAFALLFAVSALVSRQAYAAPEDEVRAGFERFVAAQNAHDSAAVRELLLDSPTFLWITRGTPIWGREAALKRFEVLYQGTWKLAPDSSGMKVALLSDTTAQLYVPIMYTIGPPGQPAPDTGIPPIFRTLPRGANMAQEVWHGEASSYGGVQA